MSTSDEEEEREMMAALWAGAQGRIEDRLNVIGSAIASVASGPASDEVRLQGVADAHKLAGSLGSFGLPEGSRLAKELELLLESDPDQAVAPAAAKLLAGLRDTVQSGPQQPAAS